jgi:hypothetical protein
MEPSVVRVIDRINVRGRLPQADLQVGRARISNERRPCGAVLDRINGTQITSRVADSNTPDLKVGPTGGGR